MILEKKLKKATEEKGQIPNRKIQKGSKRENPQSASTNRKMLIYFSEKKKMEL